MRDALMKVREEHVRQMQVNASYRRELLGFASAVIAVVGRMAPWHAIIAAIVAIYVAIYSRNDGIVDWRACLDPDAEHVEVRSSHCGMAVNTEVYRVLERVLAET